MSIERRLPHRETEEVEAIQPAERIRGALPQVASWLIENYQDMTTEANQSFAEDPDDPAEHAPNWHQFGIITHSGRFATMLQEVVPTYYLRRWQVEKEVEAVLAEEVDGTAKADLLPIAALLHDVGKFTARKTGYDEQGSKWTDFKGHEKDSGLLIRSELAPLLQREGLSQPQVEYIAKCAELHIELGKVRRVVKDSGYTMAFARSADLAAVATQIMDAHPDYALEIGLQFIADNLSKSEVMATGRTDQAIARQRPILEADIAERGLSPRLIHQAIQQPVNVEVTRHYLSLWARRQNIR